MGTKSITTAAKNFFYARQRVQEQEKLGENKTGNYAAHHNPRGSSPPPDAPVSRKSKVKHLHVMSDLCWPARGALQEFKNSCMYSLIVQRFGL